LERVFPNGLGGSTADEHLDKMDELEKKTKNLKRNIRDYGKKCFKII
jgi:hypothetical protein